jgi:putative endonuclease
VVSRLTDGFQGGGKGRPPAGACDAGGTAAETKQRIGAAGEARALDHLRAQGLRLLTRNYRVAAGPGARAGEVDLIMRAPDGTLVFVEVRARRDRRQGGAAASIGAAKRARLIYAARHNLARWRGPLPPCRFDVVAIDGEELAWLPAAFDAG